MSKTANAVTEEQRYWNEEGGQRWVEHIDRIEPMLERFSVHLTAAIDAHAGERILDIGCGGGPTSATYAHLVGADGYVLGADISEVILALARSRYAALKQLHFETVDAAQHDFAPASFDVVTSRYGVMFFPEPVVAFTNLRRALKASGRLRLLVGRPLDDNPWMALPARAAFEIIPAPAKPLPGTPGPFSLSKPEHVRSILAEAGFADIEISPVDEPIDLGSVDNALDWLSKMGPAARPLSEAAPDLREEAQAAMRRVLVEHAGGDGVRFSGAAWLLSANPA